MARDFSMHEQGVHQRPSTTDTGNEYGDNNCTVPTVQEPQYIHRGNTAQMAPRSTESSAEKVVGSSNEGLRCSGSDTQSPCWER